MKIILNKILQYGIMAICLFSNSIAMEKSNCDELLVIGVRPWDPNIEGVRGLEKAEFVDFRDAGAPHPVPSTFHHLDLNDGKVNDGANFSDFAHTNPGKYKTILIDWITYHHIRRSGAWKDFSTLLKTGGKLIIPVTFEGSMNSKQKAEQMKQDVLTGLFSSIDIFDYVDMPTNLCVDLLRHERSGMTPGLQPMNPAIIVATK